MGKCCPTCRQPLPETKRAKYDKRTYERNKQKHIFKAQKHGARKRGIEWSLTFEQWLEFWGEKLALKGRGNDDLCMGRINDTGPYALGNIKIVTGRENRQEWIAAMRRGRIQPQSQTYDRIQLNGN